MLVDDASIGHLERGESVTHDVAAGPHTVTVVRDEKHASPRRAVEVSEGEHLTLYASLISERAAYVRSPTRPSDHIVLTDDQSVGTADGSGTPPAETRVRLVSTVLAPLALVVGFVAPGGPVKVAGFIVFVVATAVAFYLTVRHMRGTYRSPKRD